MIPFKYRALIYICNPLVYCQFEHSQNEQINVAKLDSLLIK